MTQVMKLIDLMFIFGVHTAGLAFVAATILTALIRPASRTAILVWLVGAALNLPFLVLLIRVALAGQDFTPGSEQALLNIVVFYGIGASGFGWLAGVIFGLFIRLVVAMENPQRT